MSASLKLTAWCSTIGLPKAFRSRAYASAASSAGPRHADRLRGDADAPAFEVRQRDPVAFTLGAEQARRRDLAVLESDLRGVGRPLPELLLDARDDEPGRLRVDDERRNPLAARRLVRAREHDRYVGIRAARDELLDAVQDIRVAAPLRARRDRRGVGPGVRLGQAEAAEALAACKPAAAGAPSARRCRTRESARRRRSSAR
jgi:hypothetical protein